MLVRGPGGLLLRGPGGLLAADLDCCCEDEECPPCCCTEYEFTLTGLGADLDGTYTLTESVPCELWNGDNPAGTPASMSYSDPDDPCSLIQLTIGPTLVGGKTATYTFSGDDWDCQGCNTMTRVSQSGAAFPDTLEVCCTD